MGIVKCIFTTGGLLPDVVVNCTLNNTIDSTIMDLLLCQLQKPIHIPLFMCIRLCVYTGFLVVFQSTTFENS